ncbi:MAG: hypothetical protein J6R77_01155, partial [Clostridia bacterium]|nr:hypothetical protein [Clostridia bacterium]
MKRWGVLCICVLLLWGALAAPFTATASYALPDTVAVNAKSALLLYLGPTAEEDVLLFEREADRRRSPAATVRVMMGLYAIRQIRERNLDIDTATGVYDWACYNQIT